ncbi:hypothetical protein M0R45_035817 [Rubus argutus]|uniref:Uncharacterized protein n=1 Tax=Rubus argutus TaxID=59490 RepID=A0AAW1VY05_RUBAR
MVGCHLLVGGYQGWRSRLGWLTKAGPEGFVTKVTGGRWNLGWSLERISRLEKFSMAASGWPVNRYSKSSYWSYW